MLMNKVDKAVIKDHIDGGPFCSVSSWWDWGKESDFQVLERTSEHTSCNLPNNTGITSTASLRSIY